MMAMHQSPGKEQPWGQANRGLVLLLVCAILGVLAVGIWILTAQKKPSPVVEPDADPGTALGAFYMPAEFEAQDILYLGGEELAARHANIMTAIVREVAREVRLTILTGSTQGQATVESLLVATGLDTLPVEILRLPVKTMWVRDFGPLTVTDAQGRRSMVEFASGERRSHRLDNGVPAMLAVQLDLAILRNRLQVDGGDLITNGRGLCVLSSRVINDNDGDKDPEEIVQTVAAMLGFENVVLVPPLLGESSGHVDMYSTFLAPDLIVVGSYDPAADAENAAQLDGIAKDLGGQPTLAGPLRVVRIQQPDHADGIWRSYTTVVFANGVVLVPVYPDYCPDLDARALAFYRQLLPNRQVVGVDISGLISMGGTLRCVTTNVPVGGPLVP